MIISSFFSFRAGRHIHREIDRHTDRNKTSELRHNVEMYASAAWTFTPLLTSNLFG